MIFGEKSDGFHEAKARQKMRKKLQRPSGSLLKRLDIVRSPFSMQARLTS